MAIALIIILLLVASAIPLWAIGYAIGGVIDSIPDEKKEKRK